MRNMLVRAAEIRESEQQQIFDTLDEIHARLSPLESIGSVRKRLSEMPDRTELGTLSQRVEDAMAKLEAQDGAIAALTRAVEGIVDKLATPFAQLDGRLDGVAGRFEGVAGRMDGLEDKLASIHRRIDELSAHIDKHLDKQDGKLDALPGNVHGPVRERIEQAENALRGHVDATKDAVSQSVSDASATVQAKLTETANALHNNIDEKATGVRGAVDEARKSVQDAVEDTKTTVDGTARLETLAERLEHVTGRLDDMTKRLDAVEDGFAEKIGSMGSAIRDSLTKVEGTLGKQPDNDQLASMVRKSNEESERRIGGHLDEAMATFAELMMGGGPQPRPPATLPRQTARRRNGKTQKPRTEETEETSS
ncbi:MAG TPA: PA containing protein [Actinophytocola sp.]|uniref:PA containing protein n=1 Tax=Actinophytocola sp. TaxID=1872138 RepID=UPI002F94BA75